MLHLSGNCLYTLVKFHQCLFESAHIDCMCAEQNVGVCWIRKELVPLIFFSKITQLILFYFISFYTCATVLSAVDWPIPEEY